MRIDKNSDFKRKGGDASARVEPAKDSAKPETLTPHGQQSAETGLALQAFGDLRECLDVFRYCAEELQDKVPMSHAITVLDNMRDRVEKTLASATQTARGLRSEQTDEALISEQTKIITRLCLAIDPRFRSQPESYHKAKFAKRTRLLLEEARTGIAVLRGLLETIDLDGGAKRADEILRDIDEHLGPSGLPVSSPSQTRTDTTKETKPAAASLSAAAQGEVS